MPSTSSQPFTGRLIIDDVQMPYEGDYVCTIVTTGGVTGTGIASLVVIRRPVRCPTGYDNPPACDVCAAGYYRGADQRCVSISGEPLCKFSSFDLLQHVLLASCFFIAPFLYLYIAFISG